MVDRARMLQTAQRLIAVPSPTGRGGAVADELARLLAEHGFAVERHDASHPTAPAVVARWDSGTPGPVLQFDGHLDVVPLEFVPPRVEGDLLRGSGSADMKGGIATAIEALLTIAEGKTIARGSMLFTAHDLHEAPWGNGAQLDLMIDEGIVGDAVLIPEPLCGVLPIRGRGQACWKVTFRRQGQPVHEVMRPEDTPDVIAAGARMVCRLKELDDRLRGERDDVAGVSSAFVGQIHAGEIYNQSPTECVVDGTRRWIPGVDSSAVEPEFRAIVAAIARETATEAQIEYRIVRGPFALDVCDPLVEAFQSAHEQVSGTRLETGPKRFVDDGNSFSSRAGVPAITHGPRAGGQHTTQEWASIADMERVARVYVETARRYCGGV